MSLVPHRTLVFLVKTTANYAIYETFDKRIIQYRKRSTLPRTLPDVLVLENRTPTQPDLDLLGPKPD